MGGHLSVEAWLLFCLTETVLCLNPGPSAWVVIAQSVTRGQGAGVRATAGVIGANAIYFAVAASGLVAAHALSAQAFTAIKWAGAGYLLWLGSRMILRTFAAVEARAPVADAAHGRAFWRGFVAQGANPNLLVYFGAILPQFVDARAELAPQVALLALSSFVIEFTILSLYAGLSARAGRRAAPGLRLWLERAGGGLLVGAAAGLARLEPE